MSWWSIYFENNPFFNLVLTYKDDTVVTLYGNHHTKYLTDGDIIHHNRS